MISARSSMYYPTRQARSLRMSWSSRNAWSMVLCTAGASPRHNAGPLSEKGERGFYRGWLHSRVKRLTSWCGYLRTGVWRLTSSSSSRPSYRGHSRLLVWASVSHRILSCTHCLSYYTIWQARAIEEATSLEYKAEWPDEAALVGAAKDVSFPFVGKPECQGLGPARTVHAS